MATLTTTTRRQTVWDNNTCIPSLPFILLVIVFTDMAVTSDADSSSDIEYSDIDEREAIEDGIDSDGELQRKFAKGEIAPGLHGKIQPQAPKKEHKNNLKGLKNKLIEIKMELPWIERFDLINAPAPMAPELSAEIAEHSQTKLKRMKGRKQPEIPMVDDQIHDDFEREMQFYRQGQAAVMEGYSRLTALDLPTNRPEDYFAQMAKSDEHMQKVRRRLVKKQIGLEISDRVKKIREMKKYGKKVQLEVEKRKQQEKKEMMTKVKMFRKHKSNTIDFLEERKNQPLRGGGGGGGQNKPQSQFSKGKLKRSQKDKAYGFGGRKKNMKRNRSEDTWGDGPLASKKSRAGPMQGRGNKNKKASKRGKGRR
ncbi:hypothetical protein Pmani_020989 [Petrolisthes manimaculis]|uniref:rRNA-processing protein EBP2 n=1 Tax=Petrolisthes manimaculis TaxID=1843537 RepID=A0AAE1U230_9EUCA|nr:hypothetical protein Pmani_020989 [Petrolisthes manimaculis]